MKITLSWLKDYLDTSASLDEIVTTLTNIGLEVEEVVDRATTYAPFKVVEVIEAVQHPNADRLRVCQVKRDDGSTIQVVCGAPNARAGMKAVYAPEGSYIPGSDITLKKTQIRGVDSNGMLVSLREMNLGEDHDGIIDVDLNVALGTPLADLYGLNDPVIDINLTPNRPDCTGIYGVARDLAAAGLGTLKPLDTTPIPSKFETPIGVTFDFTPETQNACPLFLGRMIKGVKNGPSPAWLQQRLKSVGQKSISTLVDITNYFSLGLGRPLHVFDAGKIKGNITVRLSRNGETLAALNEKTYTLNDHMTVVCDDTSVIGLGGVMGGASTGCSDDTVDVYIECAYFDPTRTARTGRDSQIISDARYRFERGIDPAFTLGAMEMATRMVLDLCGGEAGSVITTGTVPPCNPVYNYAPAQATKILGIDIPLATQKKILEDLGFKIEAQASNWRVTTPSWRPDIQGSIDLVEEIIRIYGYDKLAATSLTKPFVVTQAAESVTRTRTRRVRTTLAANGLQEAVTWSFLDRTTAQFFAANDIPSDLTLRNPISVELDTMRPSILPNLITAVTRNADRGFAGAAIFEVGPIFHGLNPDQQPLCAATIRAGSTPTNWAQAPRTLDAYDAKADALSILESCGLSSSSVQITRGAPSWYHPGRSGVIKQGNVVLGYFGEIHPQISDTLAASEILVGCEVFLDSIPDAKKKNTGTALPLLKLAPFQPITRDFAFLVKAEGMVEEIVKTIRLVNRDLISDVTVFDIYTGKGVDDGMKSVAIRVTLQPRDKSMVDAEIDAISQTIIAEVGKRTGASLR
jgi:phenylalanyl-tRNA synthetase beta chain